jgi:hypothetical protein
VQLASTGTDLDHWGSHNPVALALQHPTCPSDTTASFGCVPSTLRQQQSDAEPSGYEVNRPGIHHDFPAQCPKP